MLKLQQVGHLVQRADSLEKTLMLGKIEGRRRRGRQRMRWLDGITDTMDMGLRRTGEPRVLQSMGHKESDTTKGLNKNNNKNVLCKEGVMLIPSSQSGLAIKSSNPYRVLGKCQPSWLLKAAKNWPRGSLFQGRTQAPSAEKDVWGSGQRPCGPFCKAFIGPAQH